jgi:membrane fusion protein (multidrug efflux system)
MATAEPKTEGPKLVPVEGEAKKPRSRRPILIGVAAVVVTGGVGYAVWSHQFEDTDDAQIDGEISNISPRVAGTIKAVYVSDNQAVKAGQLLAEIDPADYEVAVLQARAGVAMAEAQLRAEDPSVSITEASNQAALKGSVSDVASAQAAFSGAKSDVEQLSAQLQQAEATNKTAQLDRERAERLITTGATSQSEFDRLTNAATAARANVDALRQALASAKDRVTQADARVAASQSHLVEVRSNAPRQVETRKASVVARQASLELQRALLRQAELNVSYTRVVAPSDGIVGKKSISAGDRVAPGQLLMAISRIDSLWVTANFRETQLERMHPGQTAQIHVDAIDGELHGTVESIGGATGSRFSVLPPENASGNYVKVVQRIPVRIRLEPGQAGMDRLRPGMSVEPKVTLK